MRINGHTLNHTEEEAAHKAMGLYICIANGYFTSLCPCEYFIDVRKRQKLYELIKTAEKEARQFIDNNKDIGFDILYNVFDWYYEDTIEQNKIMSDAFDLYIRASQGQFATIAQTFCGIMNVQLPKVIKSLEEAQTMIFGNDSHCWRITSRYVSLNAYRIYRLQCLLDEDYETAKKIKNHPPQCEALGLKSTIGFPNSRQKR